MAKVNFLPNDFESTRQAIVEAFKADDRYFFKQYFDNYDVNGGTTLSYIIDMFAYISTYFNYMTNVSANEPFITTAMIDKNVFGAAKSLGYTPHRCVASKIECRIEINNDNYESKYKEFVIPQFTSFRSAQGNTFSLMDEVRFEYVTQSNFKENNNVANVSLNKWRAYRIEGEYTVYDCSDDEMEILNNIINVKDIKFAPLYFTFKQGYYVVSTVTSNGQKNQQFLLNRTDIDDSKYSIVVSSMYDNAGSENKWEELTSILSGVSLENKKSIDGTYSLLSSLKDRNIYIINTNSNGIQFTFGDGVLGRVPDDGSVIIIKYFVTDSVEANGNNNLVSTSDCYAYLDNYNDLYDLKNLNKLITLTPKSDYVNGSMGGYEKQSADSVRKIAPYLIQSQGRIVTDADFEAFVKGQELVKVADCKVISGEKYKPQFLGGVVINTAKELNLDGDSLGSVKSYYLTETEKAVLKSYIEERCIIGNDSVMFKDPDFIYVYINGAVFYNRTLYSEDDAKNIFKSTTDVYFSNLNTFNSYYKFSQYVTALVNTAEIDHVSLTTTMFSNKKLYKRDFADDIVITIGGRLSNELDERNVTTDFSFDKLIGLNYDKTNTPNASHNYIKVLDVNEILSSDDIHIKAPDGNEYTKFYYAYSIYDKKHKENDYGDMYIGETIYCKNEGDDRYKVFENHIKLKIGDIDYKNGVFTLHIGDFETTPDYTKFGFYNLLDSELEPYIPTMVDMLFYGLEEYKDGVFATFYFKLADSENYIADGQTMIKYIGNGVEYRGI